MKGTTWIHSIMVSLLGILLCSSLAFASEITFGYRINQWSGHWDIYVGNNGVILCRWIGPNIPLESLTVNLKGPGLYSQQAMAHTVAMIYVDSGFGDAKGPDSVTTEVPGFLDYSLFHDSWPVSPFPESTFVHLSVQANGSTVFEKSLTNVAEEFHVPLTLGYVTLPLVWEEVPGVPGAWLVTGGSAELPIDFLFSLDVRVVPVPATLVLLASGLVGLAGWRLTFKR